MNKQPTPPDWTKTVDEERGNQNMSSAGGFITLDVDASMQQHKRSRPSPEPPPPLSSIVKPKAGHMNKQITPQHRATQKSSVWNKAGHQLQQSQEDGKAKVARKPLVEEQADLIMEIHRSAKAGTGTRISGPMKKLHPVAR